ncbi:MAG TPA: VWA domain-containing protein [Phaeodactylibacter sp.]|nr:VWA domain-containing protein [Phaeodactylibacter sp.]
MPQKFITYQTSLSANVVLLCRYLRGKGFLLGMSEEADVLEAIALLAIEREEDFIAALRAVMARNRLQFQRFEDYYRAFWEEMSRARDSKLKEKENPIADQNKEALKKQAHFESIKRWLNMSEAIDEKQISSYSDLEVLGKKSFEHLSPEEIKLMMRLLEKAARKLARRKSRLKKTSRRRKSPDLKRTLRHSMRRGGEIQKLIYSQAKEKRLKIVLLCDVSRSMELYSRFFIHLIYAFQKAYDQMETLVFSTALHRVTDIFEEYPLGKAYGTVSERVPQWSGGTTIGTCLQQFIEQYAHGMVDKKTIVMILSDGWDTGAPEVIKEAMKYLYKNSAKVIWLNPLAGNPDFSAQAIGMKTAMPYIDIFASAHNLESLLQVLKQMSGRRRKMVL